MSEIGFCLTEDGTEDFILDQSEDGYQTDEIRMTRTVALKLAWTILDIYTMEETSV